MVSKDETDDGGNCQPLASVRNPRRCSTCGNLKNKNEHDEDLCKRMKRTKEEYRLEKVSARVGASIEGTTGAGTSISQFLHGPPTSTPFLPNIAEDPNPCTDRSSKAVMFLSVTSRPNLSTRYAPMLEMRTLLLLRSLNFSNFHVDERGDWAFIVSGSREKMAAWVGENRRMTSLRLSGGQYMRTVVGLVLGFVLGMAYILWVLWIGSMWSYLPSFPPSESTSPGTRNPAHNRGE
jgi:hypothetical protein